MDLTDDEVHQRAEADRKSVQIDQADRAASRTYRLSGGSFERPCCETTPIGRSARGFLTVVRRNDPSSDHAAVSVRAACGTRVQHFTGGHCAMSLSKGGQSSLRLPLHEVAIARATSIRSEPRRENAQHGDRTLDRVLDHGTPARRTADRACSWPARRGGVGTHHLFRH